MTMRSRTNVLVLSLAALASAAFADGYFEKKAKQTVSGGLRIIGDTTPISTSSAQKAVVKGIDDVVNAGGAAPKFLDQQRRMPVDTVANAFHQKNVGKSFEYLVTHPVRQTNENAKQAMKSSSVLAAAGAVAASAYGGPAGAAAFAAWTTFNATGNIEAALKVGVTQGLIASATAGVNAMPAGVEKNIAQTALSAAVAKARGANSEEVRQAALASLVSLSGDRVKAAGLGVTQRTMAMSAIGGAAVAANGGNRDAIRSGFLQGGGKILVQELNAANERTQNKVKDEVNAHVGSVLTADQISAANEAYKMTKNVLADNDVKRLIDTAKHEYETAKTVTKLNASERTARLTEARNAVLAQRAKIEQENKDLQSATDAIRSEANRKLRTAGVSSSTTVEKIRDEEKKQIRDAIAKSEKEIATSNAEITRLSDSVRPDVISSIADELQSVKRATQVVLDDGTIVGWNSKDLMSANNENTSVWLSVPKSSEGLLDFFYSPRK